MLRIENTGPGYIGQPGSDWNVTMSTTPAHVGMGAGLLGTISFTADCDATTKFTIDNYLSVKHFYDDQVSRWLSTFDVYVRNVAPYQGFAEFVGASALKALDVERAVTLDTAGTYQRKFSLPSQVPYVIGATTYYTGGYYTTVNGENVWVEQDTTIYGIAARGDFVYVLASGSHDGEVVYRFFCDGKFQIVWPVYSDATDTTGPNSRSIAVSSANVIIGQRAARRIKLFSPSGVFSSQFGSSGSADGQFLSVDGVAASEGFNSIFVSDSALGRIQRFNYSGTYQNKWGTSGTAEGNTIFNVPTTLAIDPVTEHLFVADEHARVRVYDSFGNLQAQPMGAFDFVRQISVGEYKQDRTIGIGLDQRGNAYGFQDGNLFMYARNHPTTNTWNAGSVRVKDWTTLDPDRYTYTSVMTVDRHTGLVYVARSTNTIEQYSGTPGSLPAIMNHYIAMATPDFPVEYYSVNAPNGNGPYPYIGWQGNVWEQLCDLCAVTDNAMAAFDDKLLVFNRLDRTYKLPQDARVSPIDIDSRGAGLTVEATNMNAAWTDAAEVLYDANADNRRAISTDLNEFSYYTLEQNSHPQHLFMPVAGSTASPGVYTVIGKDDTPIDPELWTNLGGKVIVTPGPRPGTMIAKVMGPMIKPGGIGGPYYLSDVAGTPTLTVLGAGIKINPEVVSIKTGLSEDVTNVRVAQSVESPFLINASTTYTECAWLAHLAGTPTQRVSITLHPNATPPWVFSSNGAGGTFQFSNITVMIDDSEYLIDSVQFNASSISLSGYRYNRAGHADTAIGSMNTRFEEIWNGRTAAEFDGYWAEYNSSSVTIAPLRNRFGYNADMISV